MVKPMCLFVFALKVQTVSVFVGKPMMMAFLGLQARKDLEKYTFLFPSKS